MNGFLQVSAEVAAVVAIVIAVVLYKGSAGALARERRIDFELDLLKQMAALAEHGMTQPDNGMAICLRLLGYDEFPRTTAVIRYDDAPEIGKAELQRAMSADPGTRNQWQLKVDEGIEYQFAIRNEIDAGITKRLTAQAAPPWWKVWQA